MATTGQDYAATEYRNECLNWCAETLGWAFTTLEGKRPIRSSWQNEPALTVNDVCAHPGNVGLRTGQVSGVVVVDIDPGAKVDGLNLPETVEVSTGRGKHFYYAYTAPLKNSAGKLGPCAACGSQVHHRRCPDDPKGKPCHSRIDIRADGGQVVFPGSTHPDTGATYEFVRAPWEIQLAQLPEWIVEALSVEQERAPEEPATPAPVRAGTGRLRVVERARRYLQTVDPAISGQGGHDTTYRAVMALLEGFGLSIDEARPLLQEYNRRCVPPWSDRELEHKLSSGGARVERGKVGRFLTHPEGQEPAFEPATRAEVPPAQEEVETTATPKTPALYQPFPLHCLPPALSRWVEARAAAIPCDPAMIAIPALAMLAAAIGATRRARLKSTWAEPAVVWTSIVALSGSTKSPALDAALEPIQAIERRAWQEHKQKLAIWKKEQDAWKQAPKSERDPSPPAAPSPRRYVVSDCTVEALAPLLLDNPRGLLLARDELAGWLGSMGQYKSKGQGDDLPRWLEMYGARAVRVDRRGTDQKYLFVPCAAVSVTGSIQPGILKQVIGAKERDSGFLARLLLAYPPERAKRWTDDGGEVVDDRILGIVERLLELDFERDTEGGGQKPVDLWLAPDAQDPFKAWVNQLGEEMVGMGDDPMRAALAKLEGTAARLALVLHLAHLADQGGAMNAPISLQAVQSGIALARWFAAEAARVYGVLTESGQDAEFRQVAEAVRRLGGVVTARDLSRSIRRYNGSGGMERAESILKQLAAAGLGEWRMRDREIKGGRPVYEFAMQYEGVR